MMAVVRVCVCLGWVSVCLPVSDVCVCTGRPGVSVRIRLPVTSDLASRLWGAIGTKIKI
jgi:hypothetical protein